MKRINDSMQIRNVTASGRKYQTKDTILKYIIQASFTIYPEDIMKNAFLHNDKLLKWQVIPESSTNRS